MSFINHVNSLANIKYILEELYNNLPKTQIDKLNLLYDEMVKGNLGQIDLNDLIVYGKTEPDPSKSIIWFQKK